MSHSDLTELECLAVKHSPEIHRGIPYMTHDELAGQLAYLRRIDREASHRS